MRKKLRSRRKHAAFIACLVLIVIASFLCNEQQTATVVNGAVSHAVFMDCCAPCRFQIRTSLNCRERPDEKPDYPAGEPGKPTKQIEYYHKKLHFSSKSKLETTLLTGKNFQCHTAPPKQAAHIAAGKKTELQHSSFAAAPCSFFYWGRTENVCII